MNATCLALVDSGIDMKFLVAAVCCAIDETGEFHLDPTQLQIKRSKATFELVFDNIEGRLIASHTTGSFTLDQYKQAVTTCRTASEKVFDFYREAICKKYVK